MNFPVPVRCPKCDALLAYLPPYASAEEVEYRGHASIENGWHGVEYCNARMEASAK